jgi:NAD(P)-dependent dehydrogenase (short-subunit alcohol dehydrogenase family)
MQRLAGKVAVVTGGARGIGFAIAEKYAQEGARCVLADRADGVVVAAEAITKAGGEAIGVVCDVTRQADIDSLMARAVESFGRIDILVNNAGVIDIKGMFDVTPSDWDATMDVNAKALFFVQQAAARQMMAQGEGGRIINMASESGRRGSVLAPLYCASKAAAISITQSAALALAKHGILVNAIAPGLVQTDMWDRIDRLAAERGFLKPGEVKSMGIGATPIGRAANTADMVGAAVFLASDDAAYVVGHTLDVNGGRIMS